MPVIDDALLRIARMYRASEEQKRREFEERAEADAQREMRTASGCPEHPWVEGADGELAACRASFRHFLRHWRFINRESGEVLNFEHLWEGQDRIVAAMEKHRQIILLKAGKLGASELECAYDGWMLRFGPPNTRVHLFSMDGRSAKNMMRVVRFGMARLPDWMQFPIMGRTPGGDTTEQSMYRGGPDDIRMVVSYPPTQNAAIDQTAIHSHVDELARMPWPENTWAAVASCIAPGGSMHIVSRGQGADNYMTTLWEQAGSGLSPIVQVFEAWDARPRYPSRPDLIERVERGELDAKAAWYAETEATMPTLSQLYYFAPRSPEEALAGGAEDAYIPIEVWDSCYDPTLPPLELGDPSPVILALDAGVTNDLFAAAIIGRHPLHPTRAALRRWRAWNAADTNIVGDEKRAEVDFGEVERWIRLISLGGCQMGHPHPERGRMVRDGKLCVPHNIPAGWHRGCDGPEIACPACADGAYMPGLNVRQIVYDSYELVDMAQRLSRDRVTWMEPMQQGTERTQADTLLHEKLMQRDFAHAVNPSDDASSVMRRHVMGAAGKVPAGDENRVRIEKRGAKAKVDLLVATSMGTKRALQYNLASLGQ